MKKQYEIVDPAQYAERDVIAAEVAQQFLSRLSWVNLTPQWILDVNARVGQVSALLRQQYPASRILTMDPHFSFLKFSSEQEKLCGASGKLPIKNHSMDLIVANLVMPKLIHYENLFKEWRRVLKPHGLLIFATLGPDSLKEFSEERPTFFDMHDVGEKIVQAGFLEPVIDADRITLSYDSEMKMIHDCKALGYIPIDCQSANGEQQVTFELIYAQAFAPGESATFSMDETGVARIPISALKKSANSSE